MSIPLGGVAWLRATAADREEMLNAIGSIDDETEREERKEIQGILVASNRLFAMETALQAILDESQQHGEHNFVSNKVRLPPGYTKIMNLANDALNS